MKIMDLRRDTAPIEEKHFTRHTPDGSKEVTLPVIREHRLDVTIDDQLAYRMVVTPSDVPEMLVGRLLTDGLIAEAEEIESITLSETGGRAEIRLASAQPLHARTGVEETSGANRALVASDRGCQPVPAAPLPTDEALFRMAAQFAQDNTLHRLTQGMHSCYLFVRGECVHIAQDIGRHNALDKAVGYAALRGIPREACVLFTSGRVPTDMVKKVVMARMPILVSKSVPTAEAMALAEKWGVKLVFRARADSFEM